MSTKDKKILIISIISATYSVAVWLVNNNSLPKPIISFLAAIIPGLFLFKQIASHSFYAKNVTMQQRLDRMFSTILPTLTFLITLFILLIIYSYL